MRGSAIFVCLVSFVSLAAAAAEIDACERLAANPEDLQRAGPGVAFFEIDGPAAVEACRTAVEIRPDLPRFRYQLALAFARMKQFAEAAAAIRPAAEAGYAAAQADLGYMLRDGLGVDLDAGAALSRRRNRARPHGSRRSWSANRPDGRNRIVQAACGAGGARSDRAAPTTFGKVDRLQRPGAFNAG